MKSILAIFLALIFIIVFGGCNVQEEPVLSESEVSEEPASLEAEVLEEISEEPQEEELKTLPEIDGEPLSEEEIEFFNDMFYPLLNDITEDFETNPWSHFFMSYYDEVWEINFPMFIYYFPSEDRKVDEEEFQKLREVEAWKFDNCKTLDDMPVPVHPISKKEVDAVLKEYTGIITSDDLDTSAIAYLEEYDCYYNSTSDWGPGMFICSGGERIGNTIYLYGESSFSFYSESEETIDMLVLIEEEGEYKIVSHQHFKNP